LSRLYGITSDHLKSIEFVDHQGRLIHASAENEFSDYFWLARGGGAAAQHYPGIITSLQFIGLPELTHNLTMWTRVRISYPATVTTAVKMLLAWQEFHLDPQNLQAPLFPRITAEAWLFMRYKKRRKLFEPSLFLEVYFFGDENLHQEFIERFLPKFLRFAGRAKLKYIERFDDLAFHRKLGGVKTNEDLASGTKGHDLNNQKWQGLSAVAVDRVSGDAFQTLAETIFLAQPIHRRYAELKPLGGAIQKKQSQADTAFWHRNAQWWVLVSHFYEPSDPETEILAQSSRRHDIFVDKMGPAFGGMYAGYVNHSNSTGRDLQLYYGGNAQRILQIKRDRDPHNMFQNCLPNTLRNDPRSDPFYYDAGNTTPLST
jgi:FAD/FMN-containing dehydrogenase